MSVSTLCRPPGIFCFSVVSRNQSCSINVGSVLYSLIKNSFWCSVVAEWLFQTDYSGCGKNKRHNILLCCSKLDTSTSNSYCVEKQCVWGKGPSEPYWNERRKQIVKRLSQLVMMGSKHGTEVQGTSCNCLSEAMWQMLIMTFPNLITAEKQTYDIHFSSCWGTCYNVQNPLLLSWGMWPLDDSKNDLTQHESLGYLT